MDAAFEMNLPRACSVTGNFWRWAEAAASKIRRLMHSQITGHMYRVFLPSSLAPWGHFFFPSSALSSRSLKSQARAKFAA